VARPTQLRGSKNKQNKKNRKILPLSLRTFLVRKKEEGVGSRIERNAGGEIGGQFWFLFFLWGGSGRAPLPAAVQSFDFFFFSSLCGVGRPSALRRSLSSCFSLFVHCMVWFFAAAAAAPSVVL